MIGSVDGIKPQELVQGTIAAMGGKRPGRGGGGLKGFLAGVVLSIAGDALLEHLGGVQEDFEKERDEADELTDKAQQCSNAIEEIVDVSDTALTELISAVVPLLNILTMIAAKHPLGRFIVPIISTIGADLIERTNDTIVNTCRDRDSAIEQCYDKFEESCTKVCERQLPETAPDPARKCPQPAAETPCQSSSPGGVTPTAPAQKPEPLAAGGADPVVEKQACEAKPSNAPKEESHPEPNPKPKPEPSPEPKPEPSPEPRPEPCPKPEPKTQPAQVPCPEEPEPRLESKPDPEPCPQPEEQKPVENEETPTDDCERDCNDEAPVAECVPEQACCGCLGALGVGVAIIGVGLLIAAAAECLENMPEPEVPAPEPPPTPEPPAPAPEPCPEPTNDGVIPPPPELAEVKEPPPPPEKVAHMQAATAPEPVAVPQESAAPAPAPAPSPAPAPEPAPTPQPEEKTVHARKAGQW
ncbi:TPA: zinc metalloprotease [Corynebacterium striatum]